MDHFYRLRPPPPVAGPCSSAFRRTRDTCRPSVTVSAGEVKHRVEMFVQHLFQGRLWDTAPPVLTSSVFTFVFEPVRQRTSDGTVTFTRTESRATWCWVCLPARSAGPGAAPAGPRSRRRFCIHSPTSMFSIAYFEEKNVNSPSIQYFLYSR